MLHLARADQVTGNFDLAGLSAILTRLEAAISGRSVNLARLSAIPAGLGAKPRTEENGREQKSAELHLSKVYKLFKIKPSI